MKSKNVLYAGIAAAVVTVLGGAVLVWGITFPLPQFPDRIMEIPENFLAVVEEGEIQRVFSPEELGIADEEGKVRIFVVLKPDPIFKLYPPDKNKGHGNDADGYDEDNPGKKDPANGNTKEKIEKYREKLRQNRESVLKKICDLEKARAKKQGSDPDATECPEVTDVFVRLLNGMVIRVSPEIIPEIEKIGLVKYTSPVRQYHPDLFDTVPNIIKATSAFHDNGFTGSGIVAAVIDCGVDHKRGDLGGCTNPGDDLPCRVLEGINFAVSFDSNMDGDYDDPGDVVDENTMDISISGHGTHVAGIIAASPVDGTSYRGVAPGVKIIPYKLGIFDFVYGIEWCRWPSNQLVKAFEEAVAYGVDIINLSGGHDDLPGDDPLTEAAELAVEAGVFTTFSAGNSSDYYTIGAPSSSSTVVSVGASDKTDFISSYSSKGPSLQTYLIKPDLVAPGGGNFDPEKICSTRSEGSWSQNFCLDYGHIYMKGTSMAAPHVAGAAALAMERWPFFKVAENMGNLKAALMNSAVPLVDANGDEYSVFAQGAGRLDLERLVNLEFVVAPGSWSIGQVDPQGAFTSSEDMVLWNMTDNPITIRVDETRTVCPGREGHEKDVECTFDFFSEGPECTVNTGNTITLAPNARTENCKIKLGIDIKSGFPYGSPPTYAYEGKVVFTTVASVPTEVIVPAAFINKQVSCIEYDRAPNLTVIHNNVLLGTKYIANPGTYLPVEWTDCVNNSCDIITYWQIPQPFREIIKVNENTSLPTSGCLSINSNQGLVPVPIIPKDETGVRVYQNAGSTTDVGFRSFFNVSYDTNVNRYIRRFGFMQRSELFPLRPEFSQTISTNYLYEWTLGRTDANSSPPTLYNWKGSFNGLSPNNMPNFENNPEDLYTTSPIFQIHTNPPLLFADYYLAPYEFLIADWEIVGFEFPLIPAWSVDQIQCDQTQDPGECVVTHRWMPSPYRGFIWGYPMITVYDQDPPDNFFNEDFLYRTPFLYTASENGSEWTEGYQFKGYEGTFFLMDFNKLPDPRPSWFSYYQFEWDEMIEWPNQAPSINVAPPHWNAGALFYAPLSGNHDGDIRVGHIKGPLGYLFTSQDSSYWMDNPSYIITRDNVTLYSGTFGVDGGLVDYLYPWSVSIPPGQADYDFQITHDKYEIDGTPGLVTVLYEFHPLEGRERWEPPMIKDFKILGNGNPTNTLFSHNLNQIHFTLAKDVPGSYFFVSLWYRPEGENNFTQLDLTSVPDPFTYDGMEYTAAFPDICGNHLVDLAIWIHAPQGDFYHLQDPAFRYTSSPCKSWQGYGGSAGGGGISNTNHWSVNPVLGVDSVGEVYVSWREFQWPYSNPGPGDPTGEDTVVVKYDGNCDCWVGPSRGLPTPDIVHQDSGDNTSCIVFDSDNIPHVGYLAGVNSIFMKKLVDTGGGNFNWVDVGTTPIDTLVNNEYFSCAIDQSDNIYIAYIKDESVYVQMYNGLGWEEIGGENTAIIGEGHTNAVITVDSSGNPVVSWNCRGCFNGENTLYARRYDGVGSWVEVIDGSASGYGIPGVEASGALGVEVVGVGGNQEDVLYIGWGAEDSFGVEQTYFMKYDPGFGWEALPGGPPDGQITFNVDNQHVVSGFTTDFDWEGNPWVTFHYIDKTPVFDDLYVYVLSHDGNAWVETRHHSFSDGGISNYNHSYFPMIRIFNYYDNDNSYSIPYVVWQNAYGTWPDYLWWDVQLKRYWLD